MEARFLHRQTHFSIKKSWIHREKSQPKCCEAEIRQRHGASALPKMGEVTSYAALQSQTCKSSMQERTLQSNELVLGPFVYSRAGGLILRSALLHSIQNTVVFQSDAHHTSQGAASWATRSVTSQPFSRARAGTQEVWHHQKGFKNDQKMLKKSQKIIRSIHAIFISVKFWCHWADAKLIHQKILIWSWCGIWVWSQVRNWVG